MKQTTVTIDALKRLRENQYRLTRQQYRTLRGQILAGSAEAAMRGLLRILRGQKEAR